MHKNTDARETVYTQWQTQLHAYTEPCQILQYKCKKHSVGQASLLITIPVSNELVSLLNVSALQSDDDWLL
jgi:hypothetical protein